MANLDRNRLIYLGKIVIVAAPWVLSMYLLYYLQYGQLWTLETPHRGKTSVIVLILGMSLSFLLYTRLLERRK